MSEPETERKSVSKVFKYRTIRSDPGSRFHGPDAKEFLNTSTKNKVEEFLADIQLVSPEQYEMLVLVRDLFLRASNTVTDHIMYGGLVFLRSNVLIGGVFAYKKHASIEFSQGATFHDPHDVLEGCGKHRRHIKLNRIGDIKDKMVDYYIAQAIAGD